MKCSRCKSAIYCGQVCQRADWPLHKKVCKLSLPEKERSLEPSTTSLIQNVTEALSNLRLKGELNEPLRETIGEFSEQDLEVLGYTKKEVNVINKNFKDQWQGEMLCKINLSCFDYALLEIKERGVREQIFTPIGDRLYKEVIDERMQRWGYEVKESPKEGDLVIYFNGKTYTHMGIYIKDGFVRSKPGNASNYVITHQIHEAFERYGDQVIFYRKNPHAAPVYHEESVIKIVYKK